MKKLTAEQRRKWIRARAEKFLEKDKRLSKGRALTAATAELFVLKLKAGHFTS